ncbi:MAG: TetR/AcrR family transcriptional regulator [Pseudomonadota bacterium]
MTNTPQQKTPWPKYETDTLDGRRQRSERSRKQIIEAMFDLMREGDLRPSATDVADRAGVGLRTVFRHFEDMDSIFEEMTEDLKKIVMPMVFAPYEATCWRDQLMELVDREARIYELVFPMQVGLLARRSGSEFLQRQYAYEVGLVRSTLQSILPDAVIADKTLFAAIEVNHTFATWHRLREDQDLTVEVATETIKRIMAALIADIDVE